MSEQVFIGIGTNLGDREKNCVSALRRVENFAKIIRVSALYKTEPVGVEGEQPFFINAVALVENCPPPEQLMWKLQDVEKEIGRTEKGNNKPRVMDLDILLYGDTVIDSSKLKIPHVLLCSRRFILEPLCQIAPDVRHPVSGKTVREILKVLDDKSGVEMWKTIFFPQRNVENSV